MNDNVLLIGAGGHASVLLDILIEQNVKVVGYVSPIKAINLELFNDLTWYKDDDDILLFDKSVTSLVNGIGSLPGSRIRADFYDKHKALGYNFKTLISNDATVSRFSKLAEGVQVIQGAIIQAGTHIGYNTIVNTGSIIDHDCNIGSNNHVAPGVSISGQVSSKDNVHFGTGSSVIQSIQINENVVVGAGTAVTKNIDKNTVCYPARIFKKRVI